MLQQSYLRTCMPRHLEFYEVAGLPTVSATIIYLQLFVLLP